MTMDRVYNFAAGPSTMPEAALETAAREMLNYKGSGMSVMEMSHRSKAYQDIFDETEAVLRELMHIPDSYSVLFLQGGATGQFAAIPMNLLSEGGSADYVDSGNFAHGAMVEAKKYGDIRCAASSREENYIRIPDLDPGELQPEGGLLLHHHQQHHLRHPLRRAARDRQRAAGGGHVLQYFKRGL